MQPFFPLKLVPNSLFAELLTKATQTSIENAYLGMKTRAHVNNFVASKLYTENLVRFPERRPKFDMFLKFC